MWQVLMDHFRRYPAQERVVRMMIQNGLRIQGDLPDGTRPSTYGTVMTGNIAIADTAIGRAADVDRRIVRSTVETILEDPVLARVFTRMAPTLHLKDVAPEIGCGVIEVLPTDPAQPGILAAVSRLIAQAGINVRQAIVEDPTFTDSARLYIVTEMRVPGDLIPAMQAVPGVRAVTVY